MPQGFTEITEEFLSGIAQEIERLQTLHAQVQALLGDAELKPKRAAKKAAPAKRTGSRALSPEARERIIAGQRKRWAKQKSAAKKAASKVAAKKSPAKKAVVKKAAKKSPAKKAVAKKAAVKAPKKAEAKPAPAEA